MYDATTDGRQFLGLHAKNYDGKSIEKVRVVNKRIREKLRTVVPAEYYPVSGVEARKT